MNPVQANHVAQGWFVQVPRMENTVRQKEPSVLGHKQNAKWKGEWHLNIPVMQQQDFLKAKNGVIQQVVKEAVLEVPADYLLQAHVPREGCNVIRHGQMSCKNVLNDLTDPPHGKQHPVQTDAKTRHV